MNERLEELRRRVRAREHAFPRQSRPISILAECEAENLSWPRRQARLTLRQCQAETVVIPPEERILFTRTLPAAIPPVYSPADWQAITAGRTLHELGPISNVCADWGHTLSQGLLGRRQAASEAMARCASVPQGDAGANPNALDFLASAVETI